MPDGKKINELTAASSIADTDVLALENSTGTGTKKATAQQLAEYAKSKGANVDTTLTQAGVPADAKATGDGIADLKSAIDDINGRFNIPNVMDYQTLELDNRFVNGSGTINTGSATKSVIFAVEPETAYYLRIKGGYNRTNIAGNSTDEFLTGTTYTYIPASTPATDGITFTTPTSVAYVMVYFYNGEYSYDPSNFELYEGNTLPLVINPTVKKENLPPDTVYNNSPVINTIDDKIKNITTSMRDQAGISVNSFDGYESGVVDSVTGTLYAHSKYIRTKNAIEINGAKTLALTSMPVNFGTGFVVFYSAVTLSGGTVISSENIAETTTEFSCDIPENANYLRITFGFAESINPDDVRGLGIYFDSTDILMRVETLESETETLQNKINHIAPNDTTFFNINDFIDEAFIELMRAIVGEDEKIWENSNTTSIKLAVEPSTKYILEFPNANRSTGTSNENGVFETGVVYTTLSCERAGNYITFTTGENIHYCVLYVSNTIVNSITGVHLYKNNIKTTTTPTVKRENLPYDTIVSPNPLNILVFGDSITDTANITIDAETNTTTAYSIKIPNNSYVKDGQAINYEMWPTLIQRVLDIKELRNYALSGAHFYTTTTPPSNPRAKLLYQVQVALNDLDNPNDVFPYDDFNPDIVIIACGVNDGNIPSGAFETTMAKTVMNQSETGVDVEATMQAMNQQNPMDAMRYVCMLIKETFPTALLLYVNPLQQSYGTNSERLIARDELRKMAEQYDFINLDGFGQFGVVRDFETQGEVGLLTKDGLHPNDKGQNLYARNMVQAIKRYYCPLDRFNP